MDSRSRAQDWLNGNPVSCSPACRAESSYNCKCDEDALVALLEQVERETLERAVATLCPRCAKGDVPSQHYPEHVDYNTAGGGWGPMRYPCPAWYVRALLASGAPKEDQ